MRNITAKGIQKNFGGRAVLAGVNFTISEGQRVALVGQNGSGKSTLLKILCRKLGPDGGELFGLENGCVYIAQDFSGKDDETPYQFLARRVPKIHSAITLLEKSGFETGEGQKRLNEVKCGDLSGGERKKLEIVAGLASGSLFIAIDEPENHLDYQTLEWLVKNLLKFRGGVVFVSNDQYFIDALADTILELDDGSITVYSMDYDDYLAEKERQVAGQARQWMIEEKTITRLRKTVEMMKMRAKRNSDTASTYQQTKRRLREMEDRHGAKPTADPEKPKVSLDAVARKKGKLVASIQHVDFAYGAHAVFQDASAELRFGEKVVLFGPNGSGKSTLVELLTGKLVPQRGTARIGTNVQWQLMTQNHLEGIDAEKSAMEVFQFFLGWPEHRCRAALAKYGIKGDSAIHSLRMLSGGQQARFKLALIFTQNPEFLILDEPTNHVDPPTWEAIVEAIQEYSGTVLAVTHDRFFVDAIAQKLWILEHRKIIVELGNLSDYLDRRR